MMMRIGICEDNRAYRDKIRKMIGELDNRVEIDAFRDGETFRTAIESGNLYDIVFMDIEMGAERQDGIRTAKWLRGRLPYALTTIIFVTSHSELAEEAFEVNPFYFLRKPLSSDKFKQVFQWAMEKQLEGSRYFNYKRYQNNHRIPLDKIRYFAQNGRKVYMALGEEKTLITGTLGMVQDQLVEMKADRFCRINGGCIINLDHVKKFYPQKVILGEEEEFLIAKPRMEWMQQKISTLFLPEAYDMSK